MDFDVVTLDTSIFEANGLDLKNGVLNAIKTFTKNKIAVVLVDIIEQEVLHHLIDKTQGIQKSAYGKLNELKKHHLLSSSEADNLIRTLKQKNIPNIVKYRWDIYKKLHKIDIITSKDISVSKLIEDYFAKKPPFSEKKKAEFPDAIALNTLKNWAETHNKKILCFSQDPDWKSYIETVENLKYSDDINVFLGKLNKDLQLSDLVKFKIKDILLAIQCSDIGLDVDEEHLWDSFFEKLERVLECKNVEFGGNINFYNSINDYNICLSSFDFPSEKYEILSYDEKEDVIDILIPMTLEYVIQIETQSTKISEKTLFHDIECSYNTEAIIQMNFKTEDIIQNVEITSSTLPVNLNLLKSTW